jgi:hypothetical protein
MKLKLALATILVVLLSLSILTACQPKYPEEKMTAEEVINKVYVYGIPTFPVGKSPQPSGQWGAVYEGQGSWRIQGTVAVKEITKTFVPNTMSLLTGEKHTYYTEIEVEKTTYYQTTWLYENNKVQLINYK